MKDVEPSTPSVQPATGIQTLYGIQVLRGIAAVSVLLHHVLEESLAFGLRRYPSDPLILAGASGVDLFFVISGFIMLYTCVGRFGEPKAASDFLVRRLIRIVPLYWLVSLLILGLALSGLFYKSMVLSPGMVLSSLLFLPTDHLLLGVGWTLQYEMYFYLVFALCLCFLTARSTIVVLPLILTGAIALSPVLPEGPVRSFFADPISLEFCFGLWLAYALFHGRLPAIRPALAAVVGLAGILASVLLFPAEGTARLASSIRFLAWGLPALLIVFSALSLDGIPGNAGRALFFLGNASYSIYLTHAIVMTSYAKLIKTPAIAALLPPLAWIMLAGAVAIIVGSLTHLYVEQPLHEWMKGRWKSGARLPADAPMPQPRLGRLLRAGDIVKTPPPPAPREAPSAPPPGAG
jgi:exopolysaccharide production protein ExoZ